MGTTAKHHLPSLPPICFLALLFIATPEEARAQTLHAFSLSSFHLRRLATSELQVAACLAGVRTEGHPHELSTRVGRYLEDFGGSSGRVRGSEAAQMQAITGHPLLAFRMLFRSSLDLPLIWRLQAEASGGPCGEEGLHAEEWPRTEDLEDAMEALLRLCFIYDLHVDEFARGRIQGVWTGFGLESRHAMAIGAQALERYPALAVEWLEVAKALSSPSPAPEGLEALLLHSVASHDESFDATTAYSNAFFLRKIVPRKEFPYEYEGLVERRKQRTRDGEVWAGRTGNAASEANFWALCSGRTDLQTAEEKAHLRCWFERRKHAAWTLGPLKVEELSSEPHLIRIYDVITHAAADRLIAIVEPILSPSAVLERNGTRSRSKGRTSFGTWLSSEEHAESGVIAGLAERMTGLHVLPPTAAEALQVASYTFGGHYHFHVDAVGAEDAGLKTGQGNRLATFMLYLSDVEAGGYTAFVNARVAAKPVKGSALFWYNLDTAGVVDETTLHGACPLLLGGPKWVANKWIRESDQFDVRKCPSDYLTESGAKENRY